MRSREDLLRLLEDWCRRLEVLVDAQEDGNEDYLGEIYAEMSDVLVEEPRKGANDL